MLMSKFTDFANVATRPSSGLFLVGYEGTDEKRIETPVLLAGLAPLTENKSLALTPDALAGSDATSALAITQTLDTTGSPDVLLVDITNTASGANTKLLNLKVGGSSRFSVNADGNLLASNGSFSSPALGFGATLDGFFAHDNNICLKFTNTLQAIFRHVDGIHILDSFNPGRLTWGGTSGNNSVGTINNTFSPRGVGVWQFGENHATAPVAQTIQGAGATSGNNNGGDLTFRGGAGSGSGARGILKTDSLFRCVRLTADTVGGYSNVEDGDIALGEWDPGRFRLMYYEGEWKDLQGSTFVFYTP